MSVAIDIPTQAAQLRDAAHRAETPADRVHRLLELAEHLDMANQSIEALRVAAEAAELAAAHGDDDLLGWATLRRMMARFNLGLFREAARDGQVAAEAFERAGNRIGTARASSCRAAALLRIENFEDGFPQLIASTLLIEDLDVIDVEVMNATHILSDAFGALAAFDHAISLGERALEIASGLPDEGELVWASYRLADRLVEAADSVATSAPARANALYERACDLIAGLDAAEEAAAELGLRGLLWMLRGIAEAGSGRPDVGVHLMRRARAIGGVGQSPLELGRLERGLGRALAALGQPEAGRTHLDVAVDAFASTDVETELAGALHDRARVAADLGDATAALADVERALTIREMQRTRETERRADGVLARLDVERARVDLRRRERETDELVRMAGEDSLTGLANRRTLDRDGPAAVLACAGGPVSLAVIDIDRFKDVNDQHSHLVGDAVLTRIAAVLAGHVRAVDLVARYAGDEFVMLLPGIDARGAGAVCERIQHAVRQEPWERLAAGLRVTTSIGVTTGTGESALWSLFAEADAALYGAKDAGRNRTSDVPGRPAAR